MPESEERTNSDFVPEVDSFGQSLLDSLSIYLQEIDPEDISKVDPDLYLLADSANWRNPAALSQLKINDYYDIQDRRKKIEQIFFQRAPNYFLLRTLERRYKTNPDQERVNQELAHLAEAADDNQRVWLEGGRDEYITFSRDQTISFAALDEDATSISFTTSYNDEEAWDVIHQFVGSAGDYDIRPFIKSRFKPHG